MQLGKLDEIRERAERRLEAFAASSGVNSVFCRQCRSLWEKAEEKAFSSLVDGDFENAAVILEKALDALVPRPEVPEGDRSVVGTVALLGAV